MIKNIRRSLARNKLWALLVQKQSAKKSMLNVSRKIRSGKNLSSGRKKWSIGIQSGARIAKVKARMRTRIVIYSAREPLKSFEWDRLLNRSVIEADLSQSNMPGVVGLLLCLFVFSSFKASVFNKQNLIYYIG